MRDIEKASCCSYSEMFIEYAAIKKRHFPAGKGNDFSALFLMDPVENCFHSQALHEPIKMDAAQLQTLE